MNTTPEPNSPEDRPLLDPRRKLQNPFSSDQQSIVFMVDDQPLVAEGVRRALASERDIDFHYCPDFLNAVSHASQIKPTVVLQDLVMPGMDGITLVRQFRENPILRDTPIVVLSSKEDPRIKRNAFEAGANDYLVKLPDSIELIARVRHHSRAHLNRVQRDEAYRALQESQRELAMRVEQLEQALDHVKTLQGLLPICCYCLKIRDTSDYWFELEAYARRHTDVHFSHGICPECLDKQMKSLTGTEPPPAGPCSHDDASQSPAPGEL